MRSRIVAIGSLALISLWVAAPLQGQREVTIQIAPGTHHIGDGIYRVATAPESVCAPYTFIFSDAEAGSYRVVFEVLHEAIQDPRLTIEWICGKDPPGRYGGIPAHFFLNGREFAQVTHDAYGLSFDVPVDFVRTGGGRNVLEIMAPTSGGGVDDLEFRGLKLHYTVSPTIPRVTLSAPAELHWTRGEAGQIESCIEGQDESPGSPWSFQFRLRRAGQADTLLQKRTKQGCATYSLSPAKEEGLYSVGGADGAVAANLPTGKYFVSVSLEGGGQATDYEAPESVAVVLHPPPRIEVWDKATGEVLISRADQSIVPRILEDRELQIRVLDSPYVSKTPNTVEVTIASSQETITHDLERKRGGGSGLPIWEHYEQYLAPKQRAAGSSNHVEVARTGDTLSITALGKTVRLDVSPSRSWLVAATLEAQLRDRLALYEMLLGNPNLTTKEKDELITKQGLTKRAIDLHERETGNAYVLIAVSRAYFKLLEMSRWALGPVDAHQVIDVEIPGLETGTVRVLYEREKEFFLRAVRFDASDLSHRDITDAKARSVTAIAAMFDIPEILKNYHDQFYDSLSILLLGHRFDGQPASSDDTVRAVAGMVEIGGVALGGGLAISHLAKGLAKLPRSLMRGTSLLGTPEFRIIAAAEAQLKMPNMTVTQAHRILDALTGGRSPSQRTRLLTQPPPRGAGLTRAEADRLLQQNAPGEARLARAGTGDASQSKTLLDDPGGSSSQTKTLLDDPSGNAAQSKTLRDGPGGDAAQPKKSLDDSGGEVSSQTKTFIDDSGGVRLPDWEGESLEGQTFSARVAKVGPDGELLPDLARDEVIVSLKERVGSGSFNDVYTSGQSYFGREPGDTLVRISKPRDSMGEANVAVVLDKIGRDALKDAEVRSAEVLGRFKVKDTKGNDRVIEVVENVGDSAITMFRKTGKELNAEQLIAYDKAVRKLNEKGYVVLDGHSGNFSYVRNPDTGQLQTAFFDPGGIVPVRNKDPKAARALQKRVQDPPETYRVRDELRHKEAMIWKAAEYFDDELGPAAEAAVDLDALGLAPGDLLFAPRIGIRYPELGRLFTAADPEAAYEALRKRLADE